MCNSNNQPTEYPGQCGQQRMDTECIQTNIDRNQCQDQYHQSCVSPGQVDQHRRSQPVHYGAAGDQNYEQGKMQCQEKNIFMSENNDY